MTDPTVLVATWYLLCPLCYALCFFLSFFKNRGSFISEDTDTGKGEGYFSAIKCNKFMAMHPGCKVKIEQKVNDVVHVPPDWLHVIEKYPKYLAAWMYVGS